MQKTGKSGSNIPTGHNELSMESSSVDSAQALKYLNIKPLRNSKKSNSIEPRKENHSSNASSPIINPSKP